ncbi:MAG: transglutaminase domain-containing protein [bacterium]|nr:transglutaminase domain-containing protein [bacterium]
MNRPFVYGTVGTHARLLALTALLLCWAGPVQADKIDPDNPAPGVFSDEWMIVNLGGQKAGYAHMTMTRNDNRVISRMIMSLSLARAGQTIEISQMESSTETVAGEPIAFESVMKMVAMKTVTRGRIKDGRVKIEKSQFDMTTNQDYPYPPGALMNWGLFAEQLRRGTDPGLKYELATYVPSLMPNQAITTKIEVVGPDKVVLPDRTVEAVKVNSTMDSPMGAISGASWLDADGRVLKTVVNMPGLGNMEMVVADKKTATAQAPAPEFFVNTMVSSARTIDRKAARSLRYLLRVTGQGDPMADLPSTGMQTPGKRTDQTLELTVTRQDHARFKKTAPAPATTDLAEYLEANIWINSDDPKVIAMARKAVKGATKPYEIADRLRVYVTDTIDEKNLNVGFATASEVCRNREGDCSEHGVLLAALGRVHKIPSRIVIGLVYVPSFAGADDVFGFHMWTQFYLGGQWVDFDAAQRESDCNPTHIAVSTTSLADSSLAEMAFGLVGMIGRLEIDVLEADPASAITDK